MSRMLLEIPDSLIEFREQLIRDYLLKMIITSA